MAPNGMRKLNGPGRFEVRVLNCATACVAAHHFDDKAEAIDERYGRS